jgi:hypothetical protein
VPAAHTHISQALLAAEGGDESAIEQRLSEQLADAERQHTTDEGINGVLVLAARHEIETAQSRVIPSTSFFSVFSSVSSY